MSKSLGGVAAAWMEDHLVFGPGDLAGQPYRLDQFERDFLNDVYRLDEDGRRIVRRALLGVGKGNAKTELAAAIGWFEFAGPCLVHEGRLRTRTDPDVPVGAASYEQADLLFGAARQMIRPELADGFAIYDTEILFADGRPGRLYRVAAVAGTNDGKRPTCFLADEIHEWLDRKERFHLVLSNGLAKRDQSLELNITTAGANVDTLAGRLYEYGKKVNAGEVDDPSFVCDWYEASDCDLDDPEDLRRAIREANPGSWIDPDRIAQRYEVDRIPAYEFRRYHLNQWVPAGEEWLPGGAWDDLESPRKVPDGTEIVVGFDGSYNNDATALYGFTLDGYGFLIGLWEKPDQAAADWTVPRHEVHTRVEEMMSRWNVLELVCDRALWYDEFTTWAERYGEPPLVEFSSPSGATRRRAFVDACGLFYRAVVEQTISHDGDVAMTRHLGNARVKETPDGAYIVKDGRNSPRKIDAAVAAIQAYARAVWYQEDAETDVQVMIV